MLKFQETDDRDVTFKIVESWVIRYLKWQKIGAEIRISKCGRQESGIASYSLD